MGQGGAPILHAKNIKPCENMVLVKIVKIKGQEIKKSGIVLMPGSNASPTQATNGDTFAFVVEAVGEKVDLSTKSWKIGDSVIINQYDAAEIPVHNPDDVYEPITYFLTKAESIWCTYEPT